MSSEKTKKTNKKKIIVISAITGILLAIGGGTYYLMKDEDSSGTSGQNNVKIDRDSDSLQWDGKSTVDEDVVEEILNQEEIADLLRRK